MLTKIKAKRQAHKDTEFACELENYMVHETTPESDHAMVKYLLDSIAWLDSFDE
jgi:hypothetical protein